MLEANFRPESSYELDHMRGLSDSTVEIYCRVPASVAAARYAERGNSAERHPVHVARWLPIEFFEKFQRPLGIGPVIEVDTTHAVDVAELARQATALFATAPAS